RKGPMPGSRLKVRTLMLDDEAAPLPYDAWPMSQRSLTLFRPSRRSLLILVPLGVAALASALFLRTGIVENTPIGLFP
ncbi:MAG: hypothetical protein WBE01_14855, partial [Methyloceanibacter sp.]